ncbi:MAG: UDP-N-acetylglucosamine 2-epimerase (non-hydrolyzing) [Acidobacteriota bacterium]
MSADDSPVRRVALVAGARPNFMKVAPVERVLSAAADFEPLLVHTGQHYDRRLSDLFFEQLGLPEPVAHFGVGSGSHATQTGQVMTAFEGWLGENPVDAVLVVGDVNSTLACGLVAAKAGVPLVHVEAGLRSFDRDMPEEINRVVVDALADLLLCTEPDGVKNLRAEGVAEERIRQVGNVMIDSLLTHREKARTSSIVKDLDLPGGTHAVVTLHRPSNVDEPESLKTMLGLLGELAEELPVVWPLHPRTAARIRELGLDDALNAPGLKVTEPLAYLDFLQLMATARLVLTDSGGIQEETTVLGVPCLTVRENTERPITVEEGTNRLVGVQPDAVREAWKEVLAAPPPSEPPVIEGWDGHAAERVVEALRELLDR